MERFDTQQTIDWIDDYVHELNVQVMRARHLQEDIKRLAFLRERIDEKLLSSEEVQRLREDFMYYRQRAHAAEEELSEFRQEPLSPELSPRQDMDLDDDDDDVHPTQLVPSQYKIASSFSSFIAANMDCECCGNKAKHLCNQCGVMAYCGATCQKEHWDNGHKSLCIDESIDIPQSLLKQVYPNTREAFIRALTTDEIYHIEGIREWWAERKAAFKGSELALRAKWASPILGARARKSAPDKIDILANEGKWEKVLLYYRTAMKMEEETKNKQRRKEYRAIWRAARAELKSAPEAIQKKAFGLRKVVDEE